MRYGATRSLLCLWCLLSFQFLSTNAEKRRVDLGQRFEVRCGGSVKKQTCGITLTHTNAFGITRIFPDDTHDTLARHSVRHVQYGHGDRELILTIDPVELVDAGEFLCSGHSCDGTHKFSNSDTLEVVLPCATRDPADCFEVRPRDVQTRVGQSVALECKIRQNFGAECPTSLTWEKHRVPPQPPHFVRSESFTDREFIAETLRFTSVHRTDLATYTCKANLCDVKTISASIKFKIILN